MPFGFSYTAGGSDSEYWSNIMTFKWVKANPNSPIYSSETSAKPVITIHFPTDVETNPNLQLSILTPFLYEDNVTYNLISLFKEKPGTIYAAKWAGTLLIASGGFYDEAAGKYNSAIWGWTLDTGFIANAFDVLSIETSLKQYFHNFCYYETASEKYIVAVGWKYWDINMEQIVRFELNSRTSVKLKISMFPW